jgi:exodeoxyribonuclease VII large subunit
VQGQGAAGEILDALEQLNAAREYGLPEPDVVVLARGGGSIEDLWEFNDEKLARAIAASRIPVVSAVGHEVDFTIADFVADLRAPTPSAAAELLVPDTGGILKDLEVKRGRLDRSMRQQVMAWKGRLEYLGASGLFGEPQRRLQQGMQRLDWTSEALRGALRTELGAARQRVALLEAAVLRHRPDLELAGRVQAVEGLKQRMERALRSGLTMPGAELDRVKSQFTKAIQPRIQELGQRLSEIRGKLRLLDPQRVLERGYSITLGADRRVLRSAAEVHSGEKIQTRLGDGTLDSVVS